MAKKTIKPVVPTYERLWFVMRNGKRAGKAGYSSEQVAKERLAESSFKNEGSVHEFEIVPVKKTAGRKRP